MKTPEEIKKGLECCNPIWKGDHWKNCDEECPYSAEKSWCRTVLNVDVRGLIRQLEAENAELQSTYDQVKKALYDNGFSSLDELLQAYDQVKMERDAAVSELPRKCWNCKYHFDNPIEETDDSGRTISIHCSADYCFPDEENSSWEWRGVPEPPKEDTFACNGGG